MPTPTERLETRKQLSSCRICAWLATLTDKDRKAWQEAILNTKYGASLIASEIMIDIQAETNTYDGEQIGQASVDTHRRGMHR